MIIKKKTKSLYFYTFNVELFKTCVFYSDVMLSHTILLFTKKIVLIIILQEINKYKMKELFLLDSHQHKDLDNYTYRSMCYQIFRELS